MSPNGPNDKHVQDLERYSAQLFSEIVTHIPMMILVVDKNAQIINVSDIVLGFTPLAKEKLVGKAPGDVLQCIHSINEEGGCGRGAACQLCRIRSIVDQALSEGTQFSNEPILFETIHGNRYSLSVSVRPSSAISGSVIVYIKNISNEVRQQKVIEKRELQQTTLSALGEKAIHAASIDEFLSELLPMLQPCFPVSNLKILKYRPRKKDLLLVEGIGWSAGLVGHATVGTELTSQAGYTIRSSAPVLVTDLDHEVRFSGPELLTSHHIKSGISVVIGNKETPWGVLGVHDTKLSQFSKSDLEFIQIVANLIAASIENLELQHWLNTSSFIFQHAGSQKSLDDKLAFVSHTLRDQLNFSHAHIWSIASSRQCPLGSPEHLHPDWCVRNIKECFILSSAGAPPDEGELVCFPRRCNEECEHDPVARDGDTKALLHKLLSGEHPIPGLYWEAAITNSDATQVGVVALAAHDFLSDEKIKILENMVHFLGDLMTRAAMERRLEQSERRLKQAQRLASMGHWEWDLIEDRLTWSDEVFRIFGKEKGVFPVSIEEFISCVHPDDRTTLTQKVEATFSNREPFILDHRIVLNDGTIRHVHERGEITWSALDVPLRMIGTVHDITERTEQEAERLQLVSELALADKEISQLSGLLPICSFCKRIRDDKGSWRVLEEYIHQHTHAKFSHGLCPECTREHYPEYEEPDQ